MSRSVFRAISCLYILFALSQSLAAEPAPASTVVRIGMTVEDIDRSVEFFTDVLDFTIASDIEVHGESYERLTGVFGLRCRIVQLQLGREMLELTQYLASPGRPIPAGSRSHDRWFQHIAIVTTDIDAGYRRLRAHNVRHASTGPQTLPPWNASAAGIGAFYFHDPDGHVLELIEFPPGKGDARWQNQTGLFIGIDHTAIVVADTARSVAFYKDVLGMRIAGGSENYGPEQERLNNVRGAHLRITTLKAASGPGIELLEYLSPRDGRPYPADALPNDLFHWQTTIAVNDVAISRHASSADSHAVVRLPDRPTRSVLVRDSDGHALLLEEKHQPQTGTKDP